MSAKLPRRPAIRALLWEDWRRSRAAFFAILAVGIALSLTGLVVSTAYWIDGTFHASTLDEEVYALAAWPVFFFGLWLIFSLSNPKDLTPRIPVRHYALPLSPRKVATVHLAFRLVTVGVLMALLSALIQVAFLSFMPVQILGAAAIAMAVFLAIQCLAWTVGQFGGWPFLVSLVVAPIILNILQAGSKMSVVLDDAEAHGIPKVVSVAILLVGIGWIAVEGARFGRRVGATPLRISSLGPESVFFLRTKHMSPLAAQVAYEWQRKGRLMPALTVGFIAFGAFFWVAFADYSVPQNRLGALAFSTILFPVYAAPLAAIIAGVLALLDDYRQHISGVGIFLYTRAADSGLHSRARLIMSLKSVAFTMAACIPIMGIGIVLTAIARPDSLEGIYESVSSMSYPGLAVAAAGYILMVWTLYWMAIPGAILWFWLVAVMMFFEMTPDTFPLVAPMTMILPPSLAMIVVTFLVILRSVQRKILYVWASAFALLTVVAAWCVMTWLGVAGSMWSSAASNFGVVTVVIAAVALSLCPAFPILAQPLLVERLRRS